MGGIEPDLAWSSLELFERAVLPQLEAQGLRAGPALDIIATLHRSPPTKEATCSLPTPD